MDGQGEQGTNMNILQAPELTYTPSRPHALVHKHQADEIQAREREAAAERTRQREAAAERSLSLQKELAAEQQHQRNLLAAAGMSFAR